MKNWILSHKILSIVLACVIGAGAVCAVVLPIALRHEHEFSAEWTKDENYHWHKCNGEKCDEISDKAAHVFDEEIVSEMYFASNARSKKRKKKGFRLLDMCKRDNLEVVIAVPNLHWICHFTTQSQEGKTKSL